MIEHTDGGKKRGASRPRLVGGGKAFSDIARGEFCCGARRGGKKKCGLAAVDVLAQAERRGGREKKDELLARVARSPAVLSVYDRTGAKRKKREKRRAFPYDERRSIVGSRGGE